jgi:hypothetical protein
VRQFINSCFQVCKSISKKFVFKNQNDCVATLLPIGSAFDRLEGEGIKINSACTPLGKRWLSSARLGKKNNKKSLLAEHYFFDIAVLAI